ncbi:MAG: zinc ABC transporter substrate-binding protein [Nitrospinota bacterium]|nr:zinc ABC transporter substrate-binding protein [Nitrospinota bacterium]
MNLKSLLKFLVIKMIFCVALLFMLRNDLTAAPKSYPFKVTTTVGMVGDVVKNIVGEKGKVKNIIGEGVDPHIYRATRNDVFELLRADIVFYSGLMLEGKMGDALIRVAMKKPVYAVTQLVDEKFLLQPDEFAGQYDPHLWMDVRAWKMAVKAVIDKLGKFDPENKVYYLRRGSKYLSDLEKLHKYGLKSIGSIPKDKRVLITAHDAFNYFGRAYDIEVKGIQGLSTESEAGLKDINNIVDDIVKRNIKAVFVETSVSSKNVRAIIEGASARGKKVVIGGVLFSDAMGNPGTYEGTYIGMLDHNITVITRSLGGKAPVLGMHGKLNKFPRKH